MCFLRRHPAGESQSTAMALLVLFAATTRTGLVASCTGDGKSARGSREWFAARRRNRRLRRLPSIEVVANGKGHQRVEGHSDALGVGSSITFEGRGQAKVQGAHAGTPDWICADFWPVLLLGPTGNGSRSEGIVARPGW